VSTLQRIGSRATLADVARRAGVSVSTASRALNGHPGPAVETRKAVAVAASELQFRPSVLARSLRMQRTHTIGFIVPDISSPFYAAVLRSAHQYLEDAGYRLMLMNSNRSVDEEVEALDTLLNHPVDGLLVATTGIAAARFERTVGTTVPCVFFDGILTGVGTGSVGVMNKAGMSILVDHLVGHGHRRIALLAGQQTETTGIERLRGFQAAMKRHGLPISQRHIRLCNWSQESGRLETLELLGLRTRPTAIIAASDDLAFGCFAACREAELVLPDDLAIVSFDDPYFGQLLQPPLTALTSMPVEIGQIAASLLIGALRGSLPAARHIRLPVALVQRASCGCGA
jgi:LacI family transcriptional regulator